MLGFFVLSFGCGTSAYADLIFETKPLGPGGTVYGTSQLSSNTTQAGNFLGLLNVQTVNLNASGITDQFVIAPDGSGITQTGAGGEWWENGNRLNDFSALNAFRYQLGFATEDYTSITIENIEIDASGVADDGMRIQATYQDSAGVNRAVAPVSITSDGTFSIDLTSENLFITPTSSALSDPDSEFLFNFRIAFYDPAAGDNISGTAVIESIRINGTAIESIPEPVTISLLVISTYLFGVRRHRQ